MSMLLKGNNGNEFELALVESTLAGTHEGIGDIHGATINFRAATASDSWEEDAPCINLFEFDSLADWLEAAGAGNQQPGLGEVQLLQPELSFAVKKQSGDSVTIRIGFHLADRPEEFNVDVPTDEGEFVDIAAPRQHVLLAAEELRRMVRDVSTANLKHDLSGEEEHGVQGRPDDDRDRLADVSEDPPGLSRSADEGYIDNAEESRRRRRP